MGLYDELWGCEKEEYLSSPEILFTAFKEEIEKLERKYEELDNKLVIMDENKANKKQEEWIPLDLLNGWENVNTTSYVTPSYMIDSFGFVHLRGILHKGINQIVAVLPNGYRPQKFEFFTNSTNLTKLNQVRNFYVGNDGNIYAYAYNRPESIGDITITLSGTTFQVGGF